MQKLMELLRRLSSEAVVAELVDNFLEYPEGTLEVILKDYVAHCETCDQCGSPDKAEFRAAYEAFIKSVIETRLLAIDLKAKTTTIATGPVVH